MKQRLLAALGLLCGSALCGAAEFEPPVRLKAGGVAVRKVYSRRSEFMKEEMTGFVWLYLQK